MRSMRDAQKAARKARIEFDKEMGKSLDRFSERLLELAYHAARADEPANETEAEPNGGASKPETGRAYLDTLTEEELNARLNRPAPIGKEGTEECPECGGDGIWHDVEEVDDDEQPVLRDVECEHCSGSGQVPGGDEGNDRASIGNTDR